MRRLLIALLLASACTPALADLVNNPSLLPSAQLIPGNCLQATGSNTVATTPAPCGSGGTGGGISGPTSSTIGAIPVWGDATGGSLTDSAVLLSNLPMLGAPNVWGGTNTFNVRPIFNGATPFDSKNLDPTTFGLKAGTNVWTGDNTWTNLATFTTRPVFGTATAIDTGNLPTFLEPYLLSATAASTYLTQDDASAIYLSQADATANYLSLADAASIYLSQASAAANYLSQTNAAATYLTKTAATATYLPFTGGTVTGPLTLNLAPTLTGSATTFRGLHLTTAGVLRFNVGIDGAESGTGNTGSDFHIYGYNDAGVFQGAAMTVTRSTLVADFLNHPTVAGNTVWDAGNFNPNLYLTIANAAATYTTPAEINTALATFLTKASAAATYFPLAGNVGIGPISNVTPGNSNTPAVLAIGGDVAQVGIYPQATAQLASSGGAFPVNTVIQAGDAAIIAERGNQQIAALTVGVGDLNSPSAAGIRFTVGAAGNAAITMGVRPSFAGAVAWDAANLTPATVSSFLTTTTADARYLKLAGGNVSGLVNFASIPVLTGTVPGPTDSSGDVASAAWVQNVITSRVGTGPFIPLVGTGMPYDINWTTQGLFVPTTPMPLSTVVLQYVFSRNVVIPAAFAGSVAVNRTPAAATANLPVQSSRFGLMGNLRCNQGANTCQFSISGGPFAFQPGDTLTIVTTEPQDTSLNGISGTIIGHLM